MPRKRRNQRLDIPPAGQVSDRISSSNAKIVKSAKTANKEPEAVSSSNAESKISGKPTKEVPEAISSSVACIERSDISTVEEYETIERSDISTVEEYVTITSYIVGNERFFISPTEENLDAAPPRRRNLLMIALTMVFAGLMSYILVQNIAKILTKTYPGYNLCGLQEALLLVVYTAIVSLEFL